MAQDTWSAAPVPDVDGDVWRWTLPGIAHLPRVRGDLRARVTHPSVILNSSEDARDGLFLVFEELASNALRHGGGEVIALVVVERNGWLLSLSDEAPDRPPVPAVDRDPSLGGLGLHLVAELAWEHGWMAVGGRKDVWARLSAGVPEDDSIAPGSAEATPPPSPRRPMSQED